MTVSDYGAMGNAHNAQHMFETMTEAGLAFCRRCWELGVAVDLSHASDATFFDVVAAAEKPVMCSHSDARALCDHPRNVTDDMLKALVKNKGYIGLNFWQDLLGMGRDIDAVVAHADHILSLGGEHILGLGSDFDGIPAPPVGMAGAQDMDKLYEGVTDRSARVATFLAVLELTRFGRITISEDNMLIYLKGEEGGRRKWRSKKNSAQ